MKTLTRHLSLHKRASCILEMIARCDELRNDATQYLSTNNNTPWFRYTKSHYELQLNKYSAIKERLLIYYAEVMVRMIMPTMNAKVIGDFKVNENGIAVI